MILTEETVPKFWWEERLTQNGLNRFVKDTHKNCPPIRFNSYRDGQRQSYSAFVECISGPQYRWEEALTFAQLRLLDLELARQGFCMTLLNGVTD